MIRLHNIRKQFGPLEVLKGITLEIDSKGVIAVLGPNGSGKTTLIKCILGMVNPDSGDILYDGKSVLKQWDYRKEMDYLPQIARFPENLSVRELVHMIKDLRNQPSRDERLIELFQLKPYLNKKLSNLSGGTRQKVNLVLAFMFDSPVLILDEPTAGLDPVSLIRLKKLINEEKEKGKTLLITTHILELVEEIADHIIFLLEGKIFFRGTSEELKDQTGESDLEHAIANILTETHA